MLPMMNFKPLTFDEANPWISSVKASQEMFHQSMQNAYLQQNLQSQLQAQQLQNQINTPKAQYAPQITLADLANKQAETKDILEGRLPLEQSEATLHGKEAKLKDFYLQNPLMSSTGTAGQIAVMLYLRQHPELDPSNRSTNQGSVVGNVGGLPMTASQLAAYRQVAGEQRQTMRDPTMPSQQQTVGQAIQPQMNQGGTLADQLQNGILADQNQKLARTNYFNNTPAIRAATNPNLLALAGTDREAAKGIAQTLLNQVSPGAKVSDADVDNIMQYARDASLRKVKTGTQLNQMQYASNLDRFLDQGTQLMPSVIKYAGLAGRFKSAKDALSAASNAMPEDYSNYLNFTRVTVPEAAGEIGRTLGKQATDQEREVLDSVINPTYWDSNPQMALKQWNWLVESFRGKNNQGGINQSLASSNADIRKQLAGGNQTLQQAAKGQSQNSKQDWISRAKVKNPGASEQELSDYYDTHKGGK